jgi:hypothetical protein
LIAKGSDIGMKQSESLDLCALTLEFIITRICDFSEIGSRSVFKRGKEDLLLSSGYGYSF